MKMELSQVLYMKGGMDEASYGETSLAAKRAISMTKSIRKEAMANFCEKQFTGNTLYIADLGCASGPSTYEAISDLIFASHEAIVRCRHTNNNNKDNNCASDSNDQLEYQVFLNDLPGNDFNSVFQSSSTFFKVVRSRGVDRCFLAGVPGSFHGRLFPAHSLHFVHASYCLQWLSQLPVGLESNKCNIYITKTSPKNVREAYQEQFQKDITSFLRSRAQEVIKGGQMVLTFCGRITDDPTEETYGLGALATILNELVDEGMINKEKLEAFNMPVYHSSAREITDIVAKQGSFNINEVEIVEGKLLEGQEPTKEVKAVLESLFTNQFGEQVIDEIFTRFDQKIKVAILEEGIFFPHVTISLEKI